MLKPNILILFILLFFIRKKLIKSKKIIFSNLIEETINEVECPENCFDNKCDNETLKCESCIDGFYSDKCEKSCWANFCKKCDRETGECLECDSDYNLEGKYCCDSFCNKCDNGGCLECKSLAKYGKDCSDCPKNCESENIEGRICDQESGKCNLCIKDKKGSECNEDCNEGCDTDKKNCEQDSGKCDCKKRFYGETCNEECDKHCENCNDENGECYECESGYYVDLNDKKICNQCPQNCDGECPNGICNKCKDGLYGDICDKDCPEKCENKRCEKETGKCDCINHYSRETFCTECQYSYDIKTECQECLNKYDKRYDCIICETNYDITSACTKCRNHYSLDSNCEKCIGNYDEENDCETCKNHYDIKENCEKCELHYNIYKDCNECEKNYNISNNCETCLNYFDINTNCENCLLGYYGNNCNQKCYNGCNISISNCKQKNGECDNCKSGYYNKFCNETCNENCIGEPPCNPIDGKCTECKDIYYGEKCEKKSNINHCIKVDKENGNCLECEPTYYLIKNTCEECSSNCTDKLCEDETGKCYNCSNINAYGDKCNLNCSKFCKENDGNYICDRKTAICYNGCTFPGNFTDNKCNKCEQGFFPISKGCTEQCSENCDDITSCKEEDGSCGSCKLGFWGNNCNNECGALCGKNGCSKDDGKCVSCIDGYYSDENKDCKECPNNCNTCYNQDECISCIDGFYGITCQEKCSIHCEGSSCEFNGKCDCEKKYFGPLCDKNCNGCSEKNGCDDKNGICYDHYCIDNYYDPRMCNETCSEKCGSKKCDIFTGECISCPEDKWGKTCDKSCSTDCRDDGRLDCCYIKAHEHEQPKGLDITILTNNLKDEQNEFTFFDIILGGFNLRILADFETNSPLVIFDNDTQIKQIETDIYTININKEYSSSNSYNFVKGESFDDIYEYEGFFLTKELSAEDNLIIGNHNFTNFSFFICQEFKIEKDFDNAGHINGIVGLGLRNYFTENLFYSKKEENIFAKNILLRKINNKKTVSIYFGDYNDDIRKSFSKLSTMIIENKQDITMDNLIEYETNFTGIAYSLRKAYHYQYEKKVIINNRIETTIIFNNIYRQFFEKIYFGDLFDNGCFFRNLQGGEGEYYCDKDKGDQIQNLPKLGLILGDYIYYLSQDFLFKKSENYYTFIIKMHGQGQQRIELGKSFFNEFSVIYNNGNETLNFFGDIKKLNVPLKDPSNLLYIDSDIFTPGGWVTLIVFITVLIIIFCYLIKYCGEKTDNEDDDEDDIDYEEDSLIDDTLE